MEARQLDLWPRENYGDNKEPEKDLDDLKNPEKNQPQRKWCQLKMDFINQITIDDSIEGLRIEIRSGMIGSRKILEQVIEKIEEYHETKINQETRKELFDLFREDHFGKTITTKIIGYAKAGKQNEVNTGIEAIRRHGWRRGLLGRLRAAERVHRVRETVRKTKSPPHEAEGKTTIH